MHKTAAECLSDWLENKHMDTKSAIKAAKIHPEDKRARRQADRRNAVAENLKGAKLEDLYISHGEVQVLKEDSRSYGY